MSDDETAFLALVALGMFSVDEEGQIWRHHVWIPSRHGSPSYEKRLPKPTRAETSHSGERTNGTRYLRVMFRAADGVRRKVAAHRVVWMVANRKTIAPALEINHIDGSGTNNHPSNLEAVTRGENTHHAIAVLGKIHVSNKSRSRLRPEDIVEIRRLCDGRLMAQSQIAERYSLTVRAVQKIMRRETWRGIPG